MWICRLWGPINKTSTGKSRDAQRDQFQKLIGNNLQLERNAWKSKLKQALEEIDHYRLIFLDFLSKVQEMNKNVQRESEKILSKEKGENKITKDDTNYQGILLINFKISRKIYE